MRLSRAQRQRVQWKLPEGEIDVNRQDQEQIIRGLALTEFLGHSESYTRDVINIILPKLLKWYALDDKKRFYDLVFANFPNQNVERFTDLVWEYIELSERWCNHDQPGLLPGDTCECGEVLTW